MATGVIVNKFGGIMPRRQDDALNKIMATLAENVDLIRDSIMPWREAELIDAGKTGSTLWVEDCCNMVLPACASVAYDSIGSPYVYATGVAGYAYPVRASLANACAGAWCRLGFPCSLPAPVAVSDFVAVPIAADAEQIGHRRQTRGYVYTLVNQFGEESQPSAPSNIVDADAAFSQVTLSDIPTSFPTYCIQYIHIYRTEEEMTYGADKEWVEGNYFLVGVIPMGAATFTDGSTEDVGDELTTEDVLPPPDSLRDIVYWRQGVLAGLADDMLHFSDLKRPDSWDIKYKVQFHDKPLKFVAGRTTGYVLTDGHPAIVQLATNCEGPGDRKVIELEEPLPIVSPASAVVTNDSVIYASKDGLVMLTAGGAARIITTPYYTKEQWRALKPETMRSAVYDGYYFGTTDEITIRLRVPDSIYEKDELTELTTLSEKPLAWYRSASDELFFTTPAGLFRWNTGLTFMLARWQSIEMRLQDLTSMTAYKLVHNFTTVRVVHTSDRRLISAHTVNGEEIRRLPLYTGIVWQVLIETRGEVTEYHVAPSVSDLGRA